jgi:lysosome membrane protein 2
MMLKDQLPLSSSSSKLWNVFLDPSSEDVTIYRRFTMFNVTNPNDACNGVVPNLVPIGPYVYRQHRYKNASSVFWPSKNEITYDYFNDFTFDKAASIDEVTGRQLSDQDVLMLYNGAFYGAAYRISGMAPDITPNPPFNASTLNALSVGILDNFLTFCITAPDDSDSGKIKSGIFQKQTVNEYIWGYEDPMWVMLQGQIQQYYPAFYVPSIARFQFNHTVTVPEQISPMTGQRCPMWNDTDACNNTGNSGSAQKTGNDNLDDIGKVTRWAGQDSLQWWGEGCRDFKGATDGTQFKPGITSSDRPYIFADAMWRPIQVTHIGDTSVKDIDTLRFGLASEAFQSGLTNPSNLCYGQYVDGFFNMSLALFAPLLISKPYYLDANTSGVNLTVNNATMISNRDRDDSFIDVEPVTGAPLRMSVKVQMNLQVGPQSTYVQSDFLPSIYTMTQPLLPTIVPFFIAEDSMEVSDKLANQFKDTVGLALALGKWGGIGLCALGGLLLIAAVYLACCSTDKGSDAEYISMNAAIDKRYGNLAKGL